MAKISADQLVIVSATVAWALFLYSGLLVATFWWVAPPIMFGALSTLLVCNLLEARPLVRPFLSLIAPAITLPYLAFVAWSDREFGLLPVGMLAFPALIAAAGYFFIALYRHIRSNNSFKPKPLRGSA
jgi:hypothetical protein